MPTTLPNIASKFSRREKLTMVSAYDACFARLADDAGVDMILVGDSLGMVVQGHATTLPVTLDEMLYHTACVARAVRNALVIADLPFMSYQASDSQALLSAGRALKEAHATAVKLEGGGEISARVKAVVDAGVPVMGHVGLQPQQVHRMGGHRMQGKNIDAARKIIADAQALQEAGCFALVLEGVPAETAQEVVSAVNIPVIGIGASPACGGQVLVMHDLLGLNKSFQPRFVKRYLDGAALVSAALQEFISDVREGTFPNEEHIVHRSE